MRDIEHAKKNGDLVGICHLEKIEMEFFDGLFKNQFSILPF